MAQFTTNVEPNSDRGDFIPFTRDRMAAAGALRDGDASDGGRGLHVLGRRSPETDRRIAIHEAGHVVAGRALGQLVGGVTIEPGPGYSGATWGPDSDPSRFCSSEEIIETCVTLATLMPAFGEPRDDLAVDLIHTHARVVELLAGTEAERQLFTDAPPLEAPHDVAEAGAHAALICCSHVAGRAFLAYAKIEASELIRLHRHRVQAVADALVERRTLDGAEIDAVIADASARET